MDPIDQVMNAVRMAQHMVQKQSMLSKVAALTLVDQANGQGAATGAPVQASALQRALQAVGSRPVFNISSWSSTWTGPAMMMMVYQSGPPRGAAG